MRRLFNSVKEITAFLEMILDLLKWKRGAFASWIALTVRIDDIYLIYS